MLSIDSVPLFCSADALVGEPDNICQNPTCEEVPPEFEITAEKVEYSVVQADIPAAVNVTMVVPPYFIRTVAQVLPPQEAVILALHSIFINQFVPSEFAGIARVVAVTSPVLLKLYVFTCFNQAK